MKKLILSFLLVPLITQAAVEYDLRKGIDLTGTNYVTYSLLNQLVDLGTVSTNKGMIIRKATRPDVTLNARYTNFIWLDIASGVPGTLKQYVCCGDADTNWVNASLGVGAVTTGAIADYSISESKMQTNSVNQYALQGNIPGSKIADNSIPKDKLAASSISSGNFYPGAIRGIDITNRTIQGTNLALASVGIDELAANAIGTSQITNGSITTDKIALTNITRDLMRLEAIGENQLTNAAVTTNKLAGSINNSLLHTNTSYGITKAWGIVDSSGTLLKGFNIASVSRRDAGDYVITFATGFAPADTNYIVNVTGIRVQSLAAGSYSNATTTVNINLNSVDGTDTDASFIFSILNF
jgi:hypothetical protein